MSLLHQLKQSDDFNKLVPPITEAAIFLALLDALRKAEGHSVTLLCDNPDGPPNFAIEVFGDWTGWQDKRFTSDTSVLDCLQQAHAMMTGWHAITAIEWQPYAPGSFNPRFTGYTAAHYFTGVPARGWCLYSQGAGCWEQRTKPALPPQPKAYPVKRGGEWFWMEPKPTDAGGTGQA